MNILAEKPPETRRKAPGPARNYLSRKEQYRLLVMVMVLMGVLMLMFEAAKPKNWYWLWGGRAAVESAESAEAPAATEAPAAAASAIPQPRRRDIPGVVYIEQPLPETEAEQPSAEAAGNFFPGVRVDYLKKYEDNRVFNSEEFDAWFNLMQILDQTDAAVLRQASLGEVSYLELFTQSKPYRGKLVDVSGIVSGAKRVPAAPNDFGFTGYWKCYLFPQVANASPMIIYALDMPEGFPTGEDLKEPAAFTGFYFKCHLDSPQSGQILAPLILAKTARWEPAPPPLAINVPGTAQFNRILIVGLIGATALAVIIAVVAYRTSLVRSATADAHRPTARVKGEEVSSLADEPLGPTVQEQLQQLAQEEQDRDSD